jgi:hypothetical protein
VNARAVEVACESAEPTSSWPTKRKEGIVTQQIEDPLVIFDQRARFSTTPG